MDEFIYLNEIIRFSIGLLFIVAAYSKTLGYQPFLDTLGSSFQLNKALSTVFAPALIATEWAVGLTLIGYPPLAYWAMAAALILFTLFTLVVSYRLFRDGVVKCNCFGAEDRPVSLADIVRNFICILAMLVYLVTAKMTAKVTVVQTSATESQVLLAITAMSLTFVLVNFHQVIAILRKSV